MKKKFVTRLKEFSECLFWKYKHFREKELNNKHYLFFYTDYFGLHEQDFENKRLMDIGCGPRGSLEWAKNAKRRIGLDPLADKYKKLNGQHHEMEYVKAYAESIPFEDNYFDFITSFNSLDHVEDLDASCREIVRCLKPGGLFLLIVDIHSYSTFTEPQKMNWSVIENYFPDLQIIEKRKLKSVHNTRIYANLRAGIDLTDVNVSKGVLTAKLRKNPDNT